MLEAHLLLGQLTYFLYVILQQQVHIPTRLTNFLKLFPTSNVVSPYGLQFLGYGFVENQHLLDEVFNVADCVVDREEVLVVVLDYPYELAVLLRLQAL